MEQEQNREFLEEKRKQKGEEKDTSSKSEEELKI